MVSFVYVNTKPFSTYYETKLFMVATSTHGILMFLVLTVKGNNLEFFIIAVAAFFRPAFAGGTFPAFFDAADKSVLRKLPRARGIL